MRLLGVDVGGTFTDFVAYDSRTRAIQAWKVPSVPGDPVAGIIAGLEGFDDRTALATIRLGTTIATNAILERKGATVAYLTTRGHRDVIFVQRGNRKFHYDMSWVKPKPLAKRRHCFELDERVDAYGDVLIPLDEMQVRAVAAEIKSMPEIQAVAVCFLFSYLAPDHELRTKRILEAELGSDIPISISYEVLPKWKEYERASTTIADAYLRPVVTRQLSQTRSRLDRVGVATGAVVIKSNGGEMSLDAAAAAPVNLVLSGPTGGVIGSRHLARLLGIDRLVTIDMGGTSTDVSTVLDRKESFTTAFEIEWGVPIQIPMIDIRTIGAGGGSIAWIDKGGLLRVGPQSAGARPGPACYGQGGTEATVTDANLVLGRINPANFLGGRMKLDTAAAWASIGELGKVLGQGVEETAVGIIRIVNNNMIGALRSVLIERGLDPRDFSLCAFGGATPLHASELCGELGIPQVVVPPHPGQFSAYGFIHTDARVDRQRTTQLTSKNFDVRRANEVMDALVAESAAELRVQAHDTRTFEIYRGLEMRYLGQNYELELPLSVDRLDEDSSARLWTAFHQAHEARFGFAIPGEIIEIVNYTVTVTARTPKPEMVRIEVGDGNPPEPTSHRSVWFVGGPVEVEVYDRARLRAGDAITGPALIEEAASITVLDAGHHLTVDEFGHLLINTRRDA